ncbi:carboxylating nicotinate-nucleotide diphosphorylase [Candidatus Avelusimicrobium gallicola]|uniref:Probable nicotinate-nucleotide pyrophosphorylase [carboxylating] n=1 Tax=Candidatus Avelusimicrobium gallicola TaxID=2562704 RepID=A0A1Y4DBN1_9BACT|nr:carboxylating nicotinate-nucleotide diphosphorylase [Elusimicrobium sp. An273]OUO56476.1 nicotinate-nucleotide diphosphorylase (carboxylating) [Elusimicrobium sp. An273]
MILDKIIELALLEDLSLGDITSDTIFTPENRAKAVIRAKEDLVLCGMETAREVFAAVDPQVRFTPLKKDGDDVKKGEEVLALEGRTLSILKAERTALNFMQRMSGIATAARAYAAVGKKYGVMIVDTRKTQPGLRRLDKYAVRTGGARNHRISLADSVMIKDNHIAAAGSITAAVAKIKSVIGHTPKIEVETTNLDEVKEALAAGADIIMLDNMTPEQVRVCKKEIAGRAIIEVSGGVNKDNLEAYCQAGPDVISMGALTHSVPAKDLSLKIVQYIS